MKKVQHMVLLKFKDNVSHATIDECFAALADLQGLIDGIEHFSGGAYSSPEGLHRGYTHGFLMTFRNTEARDAYLPHPKHERVKAMILPHLDEVLAFDYEV